jgi:hypothetical protein
VEIGDVDCKSCCLITIPRPCEEDIVAPREFRVFQEAGMIVWIFSTLRGAWNFTASDKDGRYLTGAGALSLMQPNPSSGRLWPPLSSLLQVTRKDNSLTQLA